MKRNKKQEIIKKSMGLLLVILLLYPTTAMALDAASYTKEIYHSHTGEASKLGGCYTKKIMHTHTGDGSNGGGCYDLPRYHSHEGDEIAGGGCFGGQKPHIHIGDETSGGPCYERPNTHIHKGSVQGKGECYTTPIYHIHNGNVLEGGACYTSVSHVHTDSCKVEQSCEVNFVRLVSVVETYDAYCFHHQLTQHAKVRAIFTHSSCGRGQVEEADSVCWTCKYYYGRHQYTVDACNKTTDTVDGYQQSCVKTEATVEGWQPGCGKNEETIDSYPLSCNKDQNAVDSYFINCQKDEKTVIGYNLSCNKTEETVELYEIDCGWEEKKVYAFLSITNQNKSWTAEDVMLEATLVDEKGLFPLEESTPFLWSGQRGELPEKKEDVKETGKTYYIAKENGAYLVRLNLKNKEQEEEICVGITVENIDRTAPVITNISYGAPEEKEPHTLSIGAVDVQPDGKSGSGLAEKPYSFDGGKSWGSESFTIAKENGIMDIRVQDKCGNIGQGEVVITDIKEELKETEDPKDEPVEEPKDEPVEEPKDEPVEDPKDEPKKEESGSGTEDKEDSQEDGESNSIPEGPKETPKKETVIDKKPPVIPKKTRELEQPKEKNKKRSMKPVDGRTQLYEKKELELEEITEVVEVPTQNANAQSLPTQRVRQKIQIPQTVKVVTFTLATLAALASIVWAVLLWIKNVRIYYSDGESRLRYAGSVTMVHSPDGYELRIPEQILEQSETGEYCLKPAVIFLKWYEGKELIVVAGKQKESVWIEAEIPLRLSYYV